MDVVTMNNSMQIVEYRLFAGGAVCEGMQDFNCKRVPPPWSQ